MSEELTHKLIYVAGPYRAGHGRTVQDNIENARKAAVALWQAGHTVICPHLNTAGMDGVIPDDEFIVRDLLIVARCDALYMLKAWRDSKGACIERKYAIGKGIPIHYEEIDE